MHKITKRQFIINTAWKLLESSLTRSISVILTFVLARLLTPADYGIVVIAMVFVYFSEIFIERGFNVALVRKDDVSPLDYSTALCISLVCSLCFYAAIYFVAPIAAVFYDMPEILLVLRVIAIVLLFMPFSTVVMAKAMREMQFKKIAFINFLASLGSGISGIGVALAGFGVWALVCQQLVQHLLRTAALLLIFRWKIEFKFSVSSALEFCRFSSGVVGSSLIDFLANRLATLCFGRLYPPQSLGFLNRGNVLPEQIYVLTFSSLNTVMLPALASRQNSLDEVKRMARRTMSVSMYIIIPLLGCLAVTGKEVILLLMTDKWLPSVLILQCYCVYFCFQIIRATGSSIFYAIGKSYLTLKMETSRCVAKIIVVIIAVVCLRVNIYLFSVLDTFVILFTAVVSHSFIKQEIGYSFRELYNDIAPAFAMTSCFVLIIFLLKKLGAYDINMLLVSLFMQVASAIVIYLGLSLLFKVKAFCDLKSIVFEILQRRKGI